MVSLNFSLLLFVALHFLLCFLHDCSAIQSEIRAERNHFQIVELSSLLAASTCSSSPTESSQEDFLKLVHNYGPCSPSKHDKANAHYVREVLEQDRITKLNFKESRVNGKNRIRVKWVGGNVEDFVVNVRLGKPKRKFTLIMDTGSSLLWTQCQPCKSANISGCYKQGHPIFDPSKSSTYTNITCPSHICNIANATLGLTTCRSSACWYETAYLQAGSDLAGFLAKERLSVGSNTFNNFIFGCSVINIKVGLDHSGIDGILGLGQDFVSFVEQTSKTYHKVFSYCLPSKLSEVGFLKFGKTKPITRSLKFTNLGAGYAINLIGMKIGNTEIPITLKKGDAVIDSGSSVSMIPPKSYIALRDAYRKAMSHYHMVKPSNSSDSFDTCYHIGGHEKLKIPKMSFLFEDGLVLDIPHIGVAFPVKSTLVCLPFTPYPGGENSVILGNAQQKTLEIVYDVAMGKIGFGHGGCK